VQVKLQDKSEGKGYIIQSREDSFSITDPKSGEVRTIAFRDVKQLQGKGLSKGAKIAIWSGLIGGLSLLASVVLWSLYGE